MLLNLLARSSFVEHSPTRILLHEYRGLRGFALFRKLAFLTNVMFETRLNIVHYLHGIFMDFCVLGASIFAYIFKRVLDPFLLPSGSFLIAFWRSLVPLGSLLAPFGSLLVPFWFPSARFW